MPNCLKRKNILNKKHSGSIPSNARVACETAMRDYQESVTAAQTDRQTEGGTDRRRTKWFLRAAMLRRRHKKQTTSLKFTKSILERLLSKLLRCDLKSLNKGITRLCLNELQAWNASFYHRKFSFTATCSLCSRTGNCDSKMIQFMPANHSNKNRVNTLLIKHIFKTFITLPQGITKDLTLL